MEEKKKSLIFKEKSVIFIAILLFFLIFSPSVMNIFGFYKGYSVHLFLIIIMISFLITILSTRFIPISTIRSFFILRKNVKPSRLIYYIIFLVLSAIYLIIIYYVN